MIKRIKGRFEEKDGDKYLIISPKNSGTIEKYQEVFVRLKEIIKKINDYDQPIKYDDSYMKIKFNIDDNIPLNKMNVCTKQNMNIEYDRIDISERINMGKTNKSRGM